MVGGSPIERRLTKVINLMIVSLGSFLVHLPFTIWSFDFFGFLGVVIFSFSLLTSAQNQYVCMYYNMYMSSNHFRFGVIHEFFVAKGGNGERLQNGVF